LISAYQSSADIALKLFREAGRAWKTTDQLDMADHLFNFCVTHVSLRDWMAKETNQNVSDNTFSTSWRALGDNLFGVCADIANASKHFAIKKASANSKPEKLVAYTVHGVVPGLEINRDSFQIDLGDGNQVDLLMFIYKVCMGWEEYYRTDANLPELPTHATYLFM
jgi:hypothetical protein